MISIVSPVYRAEKILPALVQEIEAVMVTMQQKINREVANFAICSRKVVNAVLQFGDYIKFFPLFVNWVGFKSTSIPVEHASREVWQIFLQFFEAAFPGIQCHYFIFR